MTAPHATSPTVSAPGTSPARFPGSPAQMRPDFTVLVTHGLTDAWQTVLWASAVVCAVLSVAIYVLLGGRPAKAG